MSEQQLLERMEELTLLYNLPKGSKIYTKVVRRIDGRDEYEDGVVILDHVDGMYSYCYLQNRPDKLIRLKAWTPLIKFKDGYKIAPEA
jgi:hypothetical protein